MHPKSIPITTRTPIPPTLKIAANMASFQLLEQSQEDELHKIRLLNVEEKPFKRITKRLLTPGSLLSTPTTLPPTPPPDSNIDTEVSSGAQKAFDERRQFREEVLLDFAAFDSSIVRIQLLQNSNARERERYATEKIKILETAQDVKDNTAVLRLQLEEAQATLNQRKKFDELTEKITNNKSLKPRDDQAVNLLKLEEECKELEEERETYASTWEERTRQFKKIVAEGEEMRRQIRDEKEEVERREGMEEGDEDGEVGEGGNRDDQTPKHRSDGEATPRPDGANTPRPVSSHSGQLGDDGALRLRPLPAGSLSRAGSRHVSPAPSEPRREPEEGGDVPMDDAKAADSSMSVDTHMGGSQPRVEVTATEDTMDTT